MFSRMKIGVRLALGFGVVCALLVGIITLAITRLSEQNDNTDELINDRYPKVMVVHLTSVQRRGGGYPWEVDLPRGTGGLPDSSVVKCGEIYTLRKTQLEELCGTLPNARIRDIDRALAMGLGVQAD